MDVNMDREDDNSSRSSLQSPVPPASTPSGSSGIRSDNNSGTSGSDVDGAVGSVSRLTSGISLSSENLASSSGVLSRGTQGQHTSSSTPHHDPISSLCHSSSSVSTSSCHPSILTSPDHNLPPTPGINISINSNKTNVNSSHNSLVLVRSNHDQQVACGQNNSTSSSVSRIHLLSPSAASPSSAPSLLTSSILNHMASPSEPVSIPNGQPSNNTLSPTPVNQTSAFVSPGGPSTFSLSSFLGNGGSQQNMRRGDGELPFNSPISGPLNPLTSGQASSSCSSLVSTATGVSNSSYHLVTANSNTGNTGTDQVIPFNWQSSKTCVKERLNAIYNKEILADVHFLVGKGHPVVRIPAHKFILSIGSAVFDAMFYGGLQQTEDDIELPDVEPSAFTALLKFLYTDEVQIGPETVMTTLYTAKKYSVPALEKKCVEFLKTNLGPDNAFMLLTQARLFDETALAQMCLDTIDKNTDEALAADGFLDIDYDTLRMVLERDSLRIREVVLFNAVIRWAEAECSRNNSPLAPENQRAVLRDVLNVIRFPLMTIEEFAVEVAQTKILTDREVVDIFLYFTVNPKPAVKFPEAPRCSITGKEQVVCRFSKTESRWGYSGTSDRIRFVVDRRIFVIGFGLYGSIHGPSDYESNIQIIHTGTGKILASNDTQFSCDGSSRTFRVCFKMPVEILANTNYTACATLKGADSFYGSGGNRKVVIDIHSGKKATFQFSYAAGCNNGTSVEDGQIPEIIFYS